MNPSLKPSNVILLFASAIGVVFCSCPPFAEAARPAVHQSQSIHLETDLDPTVAQPLSGQLEKLAEQLAAELGQPVRAPIAVVVVANLANWPANTIPDDARKQIKAKAGTTITERLTEDGKLVSIRSTVYACADGRTPQHELVHAYCWQAFGRVGPDWFAEGLAELFANQNNGGTGLQAPRYIVEYLRKDPAPPTPEEIVTDQLGDRKLWQKYAHRWALCYLLSHHPDYSDQFQPFARDLLHGKDVKFTHAFASERDQLRDDYRQFLPQIAPGYEIPQR
jgi:hypothetical protein